MAQTRTLPGELEALLSSEGRALLQQFGEAMDRNRTVRVRNRGIVCFEGENPEPAVQETSDEHRQGPRGPAARSRQGSAGRQGPADRPRTPRARPRVRSLRTAYEEQLGELEKAYPTLRVFPDDDGMWLHVNSALLDGLTADATFLVALPFIVDAGPRAWAFWNTPTGFRWMGDRHTNFFDGSICAFSPTEDDAWSEGESLATLVDLYSVWAMRHLHHEVIGRWPGKHYSLPHPYYRLVEVKPDELCTCGIPGARYGTCCRPNDLKHNIFRLKADFEARHGGRGIRDRAPPTAIADFIDGNAVLSNMRETHAPLREKLYKSDG